MRSTAWTDDRLDDLNHKVDEVARRMDARFDEQQRHMDARFNAVDARFNAVDARFDSLNDRFDSLNARFDALQRIMLQVGGGMIAAFLTAAAALIATQL